MCFTPQTPPTIALSGKLFCRNPLFHIESFGYVEKESHTGLEAGIEGTWELGRKQNELQLSEVKPGFRAEKGDWAPGREQEYSKRHVLYHINLDVPPLGSMAMTHL